MAGTMDERVVSMEFDNKRFEKNVKTSMRTIEDLKKSLDFDKSAESLDTLDKNFRKFGKENHLEDVNKTANRLQKNLMLLGDSTTSLIGKFAEFTKITALIQAAEAAVNSLERTIKQFTVAPISEGFEKYTTKIGAIKTIANATKLEAEQVNKELERLNWFTDETSASFGNMVENIGKFTSVGRGLSESITAMQGIATWGYQSGAGVAEINRAMYNLSQALGQGSVKLMDWKSIENAGMATQEFKEQALAAAEAAGTLKRKGDQLFAGKQAVTTANFNATLAKGWFTSDVLMSVLDQYGGFATELRDFMQKHPQYEQAKDAMEAMDAERLEKVKETQESLDRLLQKEAKLTKVEVDRSVKAIRKLGDPKEREKAIDQLAKDAGVDAKELTKLLDALTESEESLGEKAFKSSQQSKSFTDAIEATKDAVSTGWMNTFQHIFGGLDDSIKIWTDVTDMLWNLFASGASGRNNAFLHWAEEFGGREDIWGEDGIVHNVIDTVIELKNLLSESFVNAFFRDLHAAIGIFNEDVSGLQSGATTVDQLLHIREGQYFGRRIKEVTEGIRNFTARIKEFLTGEENMARIGNIFTAVASAVQFFGSVIGGAWNAVDNFLSKSGILTDLLELGSRISLKVTEIFDRIRQSEIVTRVFTKISNAFVWMYSTLRRWVGEIGDFLEESGVWGAIKGFFQKIGEIFIGGVDENGHQTEAKIFDAFGWLRNVKEWIDQIHLKDVFANAAAALSGALDFFRNIWTGFTGWLESIGVLPAIRGAWDSIKGFFENIGTVWDALVHGKLIDPKDLDEKKQKLVQGIMGFVKKLQNSWGKLKTWFTSAWNWIVEKWGLFTGWLESSGILPKIRDIGNKIRTFFENIGLLWETFIGGKTVDPTKLSESQLNLVSKVSEFFTRVRDTFGKIGTWLETSGILPTLRSWWDGITGWFEQVKHDIESNGVFRAVGDFFTNIWEKITGLFGGGTVEIPEYPTPAGPAVEGGEKKGGFLSGFFGPLKEAFTNNDGRFDLLKGIAVGIAKLAEMIGSIDWAGISKNVFGVVVKAINGLNEALGQMEYQNILRVLKDVLGAVGDIMWARSFGTLFSTLRSIVKKGKDKSVLEQFSELLESLGQAILNIGITVALIAGSMWVFSTIEPTKFEAIQKVLLGLGIFFATFSVLIPLFLSFIPNATKTLKSVGGMFLQMGIAIALVVGSLWVLSKMMVTDDDGITKLSDGLIRSLEVVAGIMVAMIAAIAAISLITKSIGPANITAGIATFAGMAILLGAITVCILLLQGVDWGKSIASAGVLAAFLIVMAVTMRIMNNIKVNKGTLGMMVVMGLILGVVTAALVLLKDADPGTMLAAAGAIVIVLAGLAGAMKIIEKIDPVAAVKGAAGLGAALAIIAGFASLGAVMIGAAAKTVLNDLVSIMSSMAAASVSAELINIEAIETALGMLGKIVVGLNNVGACETGPAIAAADAAWSVFVKLDNAGNAAKLVNESDFVKMFGEDGKGGLLNLIQEGLRSVTLTDTLYGVMAKGLGHSVQDLAESMKLIGQAGLTLTQNFDTYGGKSYSDGIENVKARLGSIQEIVQIATSIGTTGEGEDLKRVDLTRLSEGIGNIGAALQLYDQAVAAIEREKTGNTTGSGEIVPVDTEAISRALSGVMSVIGTAAYDDGKIGEIEKWAGLSDNKETDSPTLFALGLTNIASAMGIFSTAAKEFDNENVNKAIESLGVLAEIKNKVENPEDYKDTISGIETWGDAGDPNSSGTFANAISSMGTAMAAFGQSVQDIPYGSVAKATLALQMLTNIYTQLNKDDEIWTYFAKFGDNTFTFGSEHGKNVDQVFTEFGTGIGKLGTALTTFSSALTDEKIKYDEKKVKDAVSILQSMADIETALRASGIEHDWWYTLWFGKSDLKTFSDNLAGLGARLATFSNELKGTEDGKEFDLDIASTRWKNISGVLTFLVGIATDLNKISSSTEIYDSYGVMIERVQNTGIQLQELANGIGGKESGILGAIIRFNEEMQAIREIRGGSGGTYQLGQWSSENWENIKTLLNSIKQIASDLKTVGVGESDLNMLGIFGEKVAYMFERLEGRYNMLGARIGDSGLIQFINRIGEENGFDANAFGNFVNNMKTIGAVATELKNSGVDESTFDTLASIVETIMGDSVRLSGGNLASMFIAGFVGNMDPNVEESDAGQKLTGAFESFLTILDSYSENFFNAGKTAGEQYAKGFDEGLGDSKIGTLTPIVTMGSGGASGQGLQDILNGMHYATTANVEDLATRLDKIHRNFDSPIRVNDAHYDIVGEIRNTNSRLDSLNGQVGSLSARVASLAVYIEPNTLVGAIAPAMNRRLGALAKVSYP